MSVESACELCGRIRLFCCHGCSRRYCRSCWHHFIGPAVSEGLRAWHESVDEVAVQRLLSGEPPRTTTRAERQRAVSYLVDHRLPNSTIAERLRVSQRTVERLRSRAKANA